jgi:integrase
VTNETEGNDEKASTVAESNPSRRRLRAARKKFRAGGVVDAVDLICAPRERRFREQKGVLVQYADGGWYVRYYKDNDWGKRVRLSHRVGGSDMEKWDAIRAMQPWMKDVNAESRRRVGIAFGEIEEDFGQTIGEYYRAHYKPAIDEGRESTAVSYNRVWRLYCQPLLDGMKLQQFSAGDANRFLEKFYKRLNRNTLGHVKSLMSGIFTHAVRHDHVLANPWREVPLDKKRVRKPKEHETYSVEERNAILKCLKRYEAKVFFGLCAVAGLRPSEAAAVKWENVDPYALPHPTLAVKEAAAYGVLAETKTEQSKRELLIVEPLLGHLRIYHAQRGFPEDGLLFRRKKSREVINPYDFAKPIKWRVEKAGLVWKGCYAGRHSVATNALDATHTDVLSVSRMLGNKPQTVMTTYAHGKMTGAHAAQLLTAQQENGKA